MITNVEVQKSGSENNLSLIKRFSRRVQGSGVLLRVRTARYQERLPSDYKKKTAALKSLARRREIARLIKLGKLSDNRQPRQT